jgi:hypothetical protein
MLFVLLACTDGDKESEAGEPGLEFLVPAEGDTVSVGSGSFAISVAVVVENFTLISAAKHSEGVAEGYIELSLDDTVIGQIFETNFTVDLGSAGTHSLSGELFYEDGDELEPPVTASVSFTAVEG